MYTWCSAYVTGHVPARQLSPTVHFQWIDHLTSQLDTFHDQKLYQHTLDFGVNWEWNLMVGRVFPASSVSPTEGGGPSGLTTASTSSSSSSCDGFRLKCWCERLLWRILPPVLWAIWKRGERSLRVFKGSFGVWKRRFRTRSNHWPFSVHFFEMATCDRTYVCGGQHQQLAKRCDVIRWPLVCSNMTALT